MEWSLAEPNMEEWNRAMGFLENMVFDMARMQRKELYGAGGCWMGITETEEDSLEVAGCWRRWLELGGVC